MTLEAFPARPGAAVGMPVGGASGQILAKNSGVDYDTAWVAPPLRPTALVWTALTKSGNWIRASTSWYDAQWAQDPLTLRYYLRGLLSWQQGVSPSNQPVVVLPASPPLEMGAVGWMSVAGTNSPCALTIGNDGWLYTASAPAGATSGTWLTIDAVSYSV